MTPTDPSIGAVARPVASPGSAGCDDPTCGESPGDGRKRRIQPPIPARFKTCRHEGHVKMAQYYKAILVREDHAPAVERFAADLEAAETHPSDTDETTRLHKLTR